VSIKLKCLAISQGHPPSQVRSVWSKGVKAVRRS